MASRSKNLFTSAKLWSKVSWLVLRYSVRYDTIRYETIYLRAPKSCRLASLICRTQSKIEKKEKELKTKADLSQKKRSGWKSIESVLLEDESLRREWFATQVGFKPGVNDTARSYGSGQGHINIHSICRITSVPNHVTVASPSTEICGHMNVVKYRHSVKFEF